MSCFSNLANVTTNQHISDDLSIWLCNLNHIVSFLLKIKILKAIIYNEYDMGISYITTRIVQ